MGVPTAAVLVVAGLVIGFLPFVPDASLDPEVVLLGLLPLLVFDAAATSSATAFVRNARSIGLLAVGLVVATAAGVAAVAHWIGHLSWAMSFVLGTAVGPTDAAAATSVARRLGLPRRLLTILEGEALFNDGAALVLYAAAVTAATSGHFSAGHALLSVLYASAAGTAIGLAVGVVGRALRNRIDDAPIEIAGSMFMAYAAYLPAEAVHASGVLAAVAAGLYLGWHSGGSAFSARSRLQSQAFWETLVFLINAALFVIVGLSFHTFTAQARGPVGRLVVTGIAVVAGGDRDPAGLDGGDRLGDADCCAAPRPPTSRTRPTRPGGASAWSSAGPGCAAPSRSPCCWPCPGPRTRALPWPAATTSSTWASR